jgi:hypothetical protein
MLIPQAASRGIWWNDGWQLASRADEKPVRVDAEAEEEVSHAIDRYEEGA